MLSRVNIDLEEGAEVKLVMLLSRRKTDLCDMRSGRNAG